MLWVLIPALIFPAGCGPLAHLFLKDFRVLMHFITTCAPECCSSLVCRRQLQSCIYDPLWAEATSNGLYYYPPHSSGGNIQPRLGCLNPKLVPQGAFWKRRPGLFILLFSYLFSLQLKHIFCFSLSSFSNKHNQTLFAFIISLYTNI